MKILHLLYESRGDTFGIGGVGERAYAVYRRLREKHEVTLLCKRYPGARDGEIEGLEHRFLGTESTNLTRTLVSYGRSAGRYVRTNGHRYDVIVEEFSPGILTALGGYREAPLLAQIQAFTGKEYLNKYNPAHGLALFLLERYRPRRYRHLLFVSEASRRRYKLHPEATVSVVSNGINGDLLKERSVEGDYILYLGRIDIHTKGLDVLLQGFREFCNSTGDVRLVLAGDGRDMGRFRCLVDALPEEVKGRVEILGWVEEERKREVLKNALAVVMPSQYEAQGIAALEAMATAKPIVASDLPELDYVTEAGAGIRFKRGDARSLAERLKELTVAPDRARLGDAGRRWVREYTWEKIAGRYEELFRRMAGGEK